MKRPFLVFAVVAAVTIPTVVGPASAQTPPAGASPEDNRCAAATAILEQLPTAPATAAPAPATPTAVTPTTYTDAVLPGRGIETSAGAISGETRVGATFVGDLSGDLPGTLSSSISYTPPSPGPGVTNNIVGGEWALCGAWGTVYGTFTGGTVQWDPEETLADVAAGMSVAGGSINGVPVSSGTAGTFGGVLDHRPLASGLPPTVSGTLQLRFAASSTGKALPDTGGPQLVSPAAALLLGPGLLLALGVLRRRS